MMDYDAVLAQVWDAQTGTSLATLLGHTGPVYAVAFSPDGTRLVTASGNRTAQVWDVHLETRSPAEIAALVRCHVPWRLGVGVLLEATPDPAACIPSSPTR